MKYIPIYYHPQSSDIRLVEQDVRQTLASRMGTGGNNVPLILEIEDEDNSFGSVPLHHGRGIGSTTQGKGLQRSFSDIGDE